MSTYAKPTTTARWGETVGQVKDANILNPASGQKDTGWVLNQAPPSSVANWLFNTGFEWQAFLDEWIFNLDAGGGADQDSIRIATLGTGDISLVTGSGAGEGGDFLVQVGATTGTGSGGEIDLLAGDASGTDQTGGQVTIGGGGGTGTGGSIVAINASTSSTTGSGVNTPEVYFRSRGDIGFNEYTKGLRTTSTGAVIDHSPGAHSVTYTIGGETIRANTRNVGNTGRTGYLFEHSNDSLPDTGTDAAFVCAFPFDDSTANDSPVWRAFRLVTGTTAAERFYVTARGAGYFEGPLGVGIEPTGTPPSLGADLAFHASLGGTTPTPAGNTTVAMLSNSDGASDVCSLSLIGGTTGDSRITFGDSATLENAYIRYRNNQQEFVFNYNAANHVTISRTTFSFASSINSPVPTFEIIDSDSLQARLALRVSGNSGASELMAVTSTGEVGIGTATPTIPLEVHFNGSSMTFDPDLAGLQQVDFTGGSQIRFVSNTAGSQFHFLVGGTICLTIDEDVGNDPEVSVGPTNASLSFTSNSTRVTPPTGTTTGIIHSGTGTPVGVNLRGNATTDAFYVAYDSSFASADADTIAFKIDGEGPTGGTTFVAGELQVGSTVNTPTARFQVSNDDGSVGATAVTQIAAFVNSSAAGDSANVSICAGTTGNAELSLGDPDDGDVGRLRYNNSNNSMSIYTNGQEVVTINSGEFVGIGDVSPSAKLDVFSNSTDVTGSFHRNTATAGSPVLEVTSNIAAGGGGTGANGQNLHMEVRANGDVATTTGTAIITLSDIRTKENVRNVDDGVLGKMRELNIIEFSAIGQNKTEPTAVGVIAHEVKERFPLLTEEWHNRTAVKMSWLAPLTIKAIQEQQDIIESLMARLDALEGN